MSGSIGGAGHQHAGHGHTHQASPDADWRWLAAAGALIVAFMVGEVVAGIAAHSLALLSDAAHMLTDAAAIGLAIVTAKVASRPARGGYTYGLRRLEILSAQANGITLVLLAAWLAYSSIRRLIAPSTVTGSVMLGVALAGVGVNLVAAWLLVRANSPAGTDWTGETGRTGGTGGVTAAPRRRSLNLEGATAHVLTDLYAFAATVVAAIIVLVSGFDRADPIATLVVVGLMLRAGTGLIRQSGRIFLEAAPAGFDLAALGVSMAARPHVAEVHDLHVWEITTGMPAASAHVLVEPRQDCHAVRADLEALLGEHGITHLTLQVDHVPEPGLAGDRGAGDRGAGDHGAGDRGAGDRGAGDRGAGDHGAGDRGTGEHAADQHGLAEHEPDHEAAGDHPPGSPHCEDSHGPAYRPAQP
jgi:cobalt-zinc-cadmium efflux system protein